MRPVLSHPGNFLKGTGMSILWPQMLALTAIGPAVFGIEFLEVPQALGLGFE
jgi:hypothetical protein